MKYATPPRSDGRPAKVLVLDDRAQPASAWLRSVWSDRDVLFALARSDFQSRYKRALFGILWAVALPLLQASVVIVVFSKFDRFNGLHGYPVFVLSGVVAWTYFVGYLTIAATAIVDGSGLADKVWFPRAILPLVPGVSGLVALTVSLLVLVTAIPIFGVAIRPRLLLLPLACLLLFAFASGLGLVLSALHVYFRDVRFLVQALILMWFWVTPIAYPQSFAGSLRNWIDLNPMTGVLDVFRLATVGLDGPWHRAVGIAVLTTVALLVISVEVHRRHDRLFVDLL